MAFSYDPTSGVVRDQVRLQIGDTDDSDANKQVFTDDELDLLITQYSDANMVCGYAMLSCASSAARIATLIRIRNEVDVDRQQVAKECREAAKAYFERAETEPYATEVALEDEDITHIDGMGDTSFDYDTALDELND